MDQAARLRRLAQKHSHHLVAVLSGKGGVGKTNLALSLALAARRSLSGVAVLDADFGLGNCDVLLDLAPRYSTLDILRGEAEPADALLQGPGGIDLIGAPSGVQEQAALGEEGRERLRELLDSLKRTYELVVVDSPAGIGETVINCALRADSILLTTTPEVPAVADAYATLKVLHHCGRSEGIKLVVNMAGSESEAERVGSRIAYVAGRFIGLRVEVLGAIPLDSHVPQGVKRRKPFFLQYPHCPAARAVVQLWKSLQSELTNLPPLRCVLSPQGGQTHE